ncbi:MAG: hypothetical protein WDM78_23555 [Puia sp.]
MEKLHNNAVKPNTTEPVTLTSANKSEIQFPDFDKLDLRTGIILEAEKVAKADKLLKLQVDLGLKKGPLCLASHCILNPKILLTAGGSCSQSGPP